MFRANDFFEKIPYCNLFIVAKYVSKQLKKFKIINGKNQ